MLEKQTKKQGVMRQCPTCKYQEAVAITATPGHTNGHAGTTAALAPRRAADEVELDAVGR
jgi:hypothetical protein